MRPPCFAQPSTSALLLRGAMARVEYVNVNDLIRDFLQQKADQAVLTQRVQALEARAAKSEAKAAKTEKKAHATLKWAVIQIKKKQK